MATGIPELQTKEALSKRLSIATEQAAEILDFLVRKGLVIRNGNQFQVSTKSIHLPNQSPLISKHHTNWRVRAMTSLDKSNDTDLHYSSVITLSRHDLDGVKSLLIEAIREVKTRVRESKDEELCCFSLDLFAV